jgi:hypothetical protein
MRLALGWSGDCCAELGLCRGFKRPAQPGNFTYAVNTRSTVQMQAGTYHGRFNLTLDKPINKVAVSTEGHEICRGEDSVEWGVDYTLSDWQKLLVIEGSGVRAGSAAMSERDSFAPA